MKIKDFQFLALRGKASDDPKIIKWKIKKQKPRRRK